MSYIFSGPIQTIIRAMDSSIGTSRRKRLFFLFLSAIGTILCFGVIRSWTYVPTYTHLIYLDHPFSIDSTSSHFVTAEVEIMMYDGYIVNGNTDEKHKMTRSCIFRYEKRAKKKGIKKPITPSSEDVNRYLGLPVFSEMGSAGSAPLSWVGNVGVFCHTFNTGGEQLIERDPLEVDVINQEDESSENTPSIFIHSIDDNNVLKNSAYESLNQRLPQIAYDARSGRLIHSYSCVVSNYSDTIASIGHSVDNNNLDWWGKVCYHVGQFVKCQDISRCCYTVYVATSGLDSINVKMFLYEDADIFSGFEKTGKNYIEYSSVGDSEPENGAKLFTFSANLLESENTQLVRLFFITTLCAVCFGFFMKYSVQLILSIRFIRKKKNYYEKK